MDNYELSDVIVHWHDHPGDFVRDVFEVEPDVWQESALDDLVTEDRISIRSGHGIGKSAFMSWAVLWWLVTRHEAKAVCTAPTAHQLGDVLWGELDKWWRKAPAALQPLLTITSDRVTKVTSPKATYATARTARRENPEALQGFHSPNQLFIIDEASGVDDVIFQVGEGSLSTAGSKVLMVGNPTRTSGYFYDSHHDNRKLWHTIHVNSADAKMTDEKWVNIMRDQYGEESNVYRVRVLGEFPSNEDNAVIPLDWCENAQTRAVRPIRGKIIWGLDVARFGNDSTALCKREKNVVTDIKEWRHLDLMQTAGRVLHEYELAEAANKAPDVIMIDVIGLGAGVVDRLREQGLPVRGINVAESAAAKKKFVRLRDEMWWKGREWFEAKDVRLPKTEAGKDLIGELVGPTYTIESSGKIKVESKKDMKTRGIQSPNLADAFLLTLLVSDFKGSTGPIQYKNLGNIL